MNRKRTRWVVIPIALLLSACANVPHIQLPQQYRLPQAPLAATFERKVGRIALLDDSGNLVIMDQTGGNVVKITTDANGTTAQNTSTRPTEMTYHYPVWSPDASQIAFVEMTAVRGSTNRVIEYGADSVTVQRGSQSVTLQQDETGSTSARRAPDTISTERQPSRVIIERNSGGEILGSSIYLARADGKAPLQELYNLNSGALGYLDWSPDNSQLAFLSQLQQGETDLNVIARNAAKPRKVLTGVSAAWNWSPDGKSLLARVDTSASEDTSDLALWDAQNGKSPTEIAQGVSLPYDAPAYSPDGNAMLITVQSNNRNYLALADRQGKVTRKLSQVIGHVNYVWSPAGAEVAYIDTAVSGGNTDALQAPVGGALHILDVNTGVDKLLTQSPVSSFFWSPDGQRLATFSPVQPGQMSRNFPGMDLTSNQPNSMFMLQVMNVNTRDTRQLFYLEPTQEFSQLMDQFDRFSHSMNIWSPDSGHLVLSIIDTNQQPSVIETEATGSIEPRVLSKGTLAVWSPR